MMKVYNATVGVELDENDFENIADDLKDSIEGALDCELWDYFSNEQQDSIIEQALKDFIEWLTKKQLDNPANP